MNNESGVSGSFSGSGSTTTSSREHVGRRTNNNNNNNNTSTSRENVVNVNNTPRKNKCGTCGKFHKPPCRHASLGNNNNSNNNIKNSNGIGYGYGNTSSSPNDNNTTSAISSGLYGYGNALSPCGTRGKFQKPPCRHVSLGNNNNKNSNGIGIGYGCGNTSSSPNNSSTTSTISSGLYGYGNGKASSPPPNNNSNTTSIIINSRNDTRKGRRQKRMTAKTKIYTGPNNFLKMHRMSGAVRYKVHKPKCDCSKLIQLISTIDYSDDSDVITEEGGGGIDGLVVVPDNKQRIVYLCSETNQDIFDNDPLMAELKLRDEIFSPSKMLSSADADAGADVETIATATTVVDESQFKVSCASCLLMANEPNGFCLVASSSSTSLDLVDEVRDRSRLRKEEKEAIGEALHPDHAHFVARLPRSSLWKLCQSKTRSQRSQALDEIFVHLSGQDIDNNIINVDNNIERFTNGIELGHHLLSLLNLTDGTNQRYCADADANSNVDYWLVLGYDDAKSLMLDLPGGKRHLGETSLEGAIRETEEEMSLIWDPSWVVQTVQGKKKSDVGNRYFILHPPSSSL
jgi:hypothetical protein